MESSYRSDNLYPSIRVVPAEINETQNSPEFNNIKLFRISCIIIMQGLSIGEIHDRNKISKFICKYVNVLEFFTCVSFFIYIINRWTSWT